MEISYKITTVYKNNQSVVDYEGLKYILMLLSRDDIMKLNIEVLDDSYNTIDIDSKLFNLYSNNDSINGMKPDKSSMDDVYECQTC